MESEVVSKIKERFISEILKALVTPNLPSRFYSDKDESAYNEFVKSARSGKKDVTATVPFDFIIRDDLFNLIKDEKAFVVSSVKFNAVVSTKRPNRTCSAIYTSTYSSCPFEYTFLDNHPGIINVDKIKDIPIDYEGLMAVPATILEYKNFTRFNIHRILYAPIYNGKRIYPRVVISNKCTVTD